MTERRPWWHILLEGAVSYFQVRVMFPRDASEKAAFWHRLTRYLNRVASWFGRLALAAEAHYWRVVTP